ncbi:CU044_5270 family protein [Streptomyces tailanensis]|uniref:CU044_5270 family protein n=1 Tax=Streptomyces tailanensis TaxID=2569858 RepID=UPI00122E43E7|nr:CU044_5270 family protein [Streptomyces tailanensis]
MNPEERAELARLLPSPGDPVLPSDRLLQLEDHLMREITGEEALRTDLVVETPQPDATGDATEDVPSYDAAVEIRRPSSSAYVRRPRRRGFGRPGGPRRRRTALIAVPFGAAVAVASVLVMVAVSDPDRPATDADALRLLDRIAGAATATTATMPPLRDDQYIYTEVRGTMKAPMEAWMETPEADEKETKEAAKKEYPYHRIDWVAVDGKRNGLARTTWPEGQYIPEGMPDGDIKEALEKTTEDMTLSADPNGFNYRELQKMPTDPDKLYEKVWAETSGQGPTHEEAALEYIDTMLDIAQLLPELDSALVRAAAKVPGVTVVQNAKDAVGREGIGLSFGQGEDRVVRVFDKQSLKYLGSDREALLEVGVVDKKGEALGD